MRTAFMKLLVIAPFALTLSACNTTGILPANEAAYIDKVDVSHAQNIGTPRFAEVVGSRTRVEATRYGRAGAARNLRIDVVEVHYKNPAMSLLVGDSNYVRARVTVIDPATKRVIGEGEANALDNFAINGVVGAIMAAAQDKEKVDGRLADGLARNVLERVYGSAAAAEARKRTAAEPATAPAAPGAAPAPAAPAKQVPVAAAKKKNRAAALTGPAGVAG